MYRVVEIGIRPGEVTNPEAKRDARYIYIYTYILYQAVDLTPDRKERERLLVARPGVLFIDQLMTDSSYHTLAIGTVRVLEMLRKV